MKDIVSESYYLRDECDPLKLKWGRRSDFTQCHNDWESNLRIKSVFDNKDKHEDLCFSGYEFSPRSASFDYIDPSTLSSLQLINCSNWDFVFDSLFYNVSRLKLKKLTIHQPKSVGAYGRQSLQCFLTTYEGLEEIEFSSLGHSRQCLRTISAQSATLKILKLHEPAISDSKKSYVPWTLADAEMIATRKDHLQDVENVAKIRMSCPELRQVVIDHKRIDLGIMDT